MNFETPNNSVENQEFNESKLESIAEDLVNGIAEKVDMSKIKSIHQAAEEFQQAA